MRTIKARLTRLEKKAKELAAPVEYCACPLDYYAAIAPLSPHPPTPEEIANLLPPGDDCDRCGKPKRDNIKIVAYAATTTELYADGTDQSETTN